MKENLRVVYPSNEDNGVKAKRGAHFGKAKFYTIIDIKNNEVKNIETLRNEGHEAGGCTSAVSTIMNFNPDALVVSGIGSKPANNFKEVGLAVYFDESSKTIQDSIALFLDNKLRNINGIGTCSKH